MAAITLGSNSFNMLLAQPNHPFPTVIAKHKRKVRLARGLAATGRLDPQAVTEALACLQWFGLLLKQTQVHQVQVVATAALRQALDGAEFCRRAEPLLGYPIAVISGDREAELIFQGMRATTKVDGRCLMIDVGGASTELVIGDNDIDYKISLPFGAVLYTERFFAAGINQASLVAARAAVIGALAPVRQSLLQLGWQQALGISGSFRSVFEYEQSNIAANAPISPAKLMELEAKLLANNGELPGLCIERQPTFAAGIAILSGLMSSLQIEAFYPAGGALREGVLLQLNQQVEVAGAALELN
ncbi:Ppx/GppA phosphatase family protein [Ferrimonas senticii]|uniref:Ppx/GppA phosphatase family protein n=1 Tax=Ferrimonas senticii TaxID=394566 RepID=UPI00040441C5|nr:Ppx/GppA phosphatase family protein [Ferrimonas senticii]